MLKTEVRKVNRSAFLQLVFSGIYSNNPKAYLEVLLVHPSGTAAVAAQQGIAPTYHISSGQQSGKRSMGSFNLLHSWSNPQVELA